MTPDERIDKMVKLANEAMTTDVGKRLFAACAVDGLFNRVVGADNPERVAIAKSMSQAAIIQVADREADELTPDERKRLIDDVSEHLQWSVVTATRHSWTVAEALNYDPEQVLTPEGIAFHAAVLTIPADAEHGEVPAP